MKCPQDVDVDLVMSERQGVEIDYCPSCRGVWLDRGELDKILDRAAAQVTPSAAGHVPGEGGLGPAAGVPAGYESQPGAGGGGYASGYGSGYGSGGPGAEGSGRYGEDQGRYADDRSRHSDDRGRYGEDRERYGDDRGRYDDDHGRRPGHDPRRKRKESWLGDLLDFG